MKQEPVTFLGWVEDLFKTPAGIPRNTYAVIKADYDKIIALRVSKYASFAANRPQDIVTALTQGPEEIADLKGVTTIIQLRDLFSSPKDTLTALGKSTFNDILNIDEVAADRRALALSRLTRGQTTDGVNPSIPDSQYRDKGKPLDKPNNIVLSASRLVPLGNSVTERTPSGGLRSTIQLVKDRTYGSDPQGEGIWEDRKFLDEEESGLQPKATQYRTYTSLAANLSTLANSLETGSGREIARDGAIIDFNRTVARELGYDLDDVLNTTSKKIGPAKKRIKAGQKTEGSLYDVKGKLHEELIRNGNDIETLIADPDRIDTVLKNGSFGGRSFNSLSPIEQEMAKSFLRYEEAHLRTSYIHPIIDTSPQIINKLRSAGLSVEIEGTKYEKYLTQGHFMGDLKRLQGKHAMEFYTKFLAYEDAVRDLIDKRANEIGSQEFARQKNLGATDVQAQRRALHLSNRVKADTKSRFESAYKAAETANSLFFAGLTKDILEQVESGSLMKAMVISSRFAGALPFAPQWMRPTVENLNSINLDRLLSENPDKSLMYPVIGPIAKFGYDLPKKIAKNIGLSTTSTGTSFTIPDTDKAMPKHLRAINDRTNGILESRTWLEWQTRDSGGKRIGKHKIQRIRATEAAGIYDQTGVYTMISAADDHFMVMGRPGKINGVNLLEDFDTLDQFYDDLDAVNTSLKAGQTTATTSLATFDEYKDFIAEYGFDEPIGKTGLTLLDQYINTKRSSFDISGKNLLNKLSDQTQLGVDRLHEQDRWRFLQRTFRSGKGAELIGRYAFLLDNYNRWANSVRNNFYNNIIFGDFGKKLPVVGRFLTWLQGIGFADELVLADVIKGSKLVKTIEGFGRALQIGTQTGSTLAKGAGARIGLKLAQKQVGSMIAKSLGFVISNTGAILTGGASYVLTAFSDTIWAFGKNALTLNFGKAVSESWETLKKKGEVAKKVILYPIACSCGCLILPVLIIVVIIPSIITPLGGTGGGSYDETLSDVFTVKKEASEFTNSIEYTITVTNKTNDPATIGSFVDTLSYIPDCGKTQGNLGEAGFIGTLDPASPIPNPVGETISPSSSKTYKFTLLNISPETEDSTYFNSIQITAASEAGTGKAAFSSASTTRGKGGCVKCPGGWPATGSIAVTQGPFTTSSHSLTEAVDLIGGGDIVATHDGQVRFIGNSSCIGKNSYDDPSLKGVISSYGCYIIVDSLDGRFSTLYGHMVAPNDSSLSKGQFINRGQILGKMGNTGYSSGTHLHYEFLNDGVQCLPNIDAPLRLKQYSGDNYVPTSINRGCVDNCNQSF